MLIYCIVDAPRRITEDIAKNTDFARILLPPPAATLPLPYLSNSYVLPTFLSPNKQSTNMGSSGPTMTGGREADT